MLQDIAPDVKDRASGLERFLPRQHGEPGHLLLLHPKREVLLVENLVNLDQLRMKRFEFHAPPLNMKGAAGSPVRPVAVEEV